MLIVHWLFWLMFDYFCLFLFDLYLFWLLKDPTYVAWYVFDLFVDFVEVFYQNHQSTKAAWLRSLKTTANLRGKIRKSTCWPEAFERGRGKWRQQLADCQLAWGTTQTCALALRTLGCLDGLDGPSERCNAIILYIIQRNINIYIHFWRGEASRNGCAWEGATLPNSPKLYMCKF